MELNHSLERQSPECRLLVSDQAGLCLRPPDGDDLLLSERERVPTNPDGPVGLEDVEPSASRRVRKHRAQRPLAAVVFQEWVVQEADVGMQRGVR